MVLKLKFSLETFHGARMRIPSDRDSALTEMSLLLSSCTTKKERAEVSLSLSTQAHRELMLASTPSQETPLTEERLDATSLLTRAEHPRETAASSREEVSKLAVDRETLQNPPLFSLETFLSLAPRIPLWLISVMALRTLGSLWMRTNA